MIAFSGFDGPVPANALFGRASGPGQRDPVHEPGRARRRIGRLTPIYPTKPFAQSVIGAAANAADQRAAEAEHAVGDLPEGYTGRCSHADGASVLQLRPVSDLFTLTPVPDATWGLHLSDANIALGNLTDLVRRQIRIYTGR